MLNNAPMISTCSGSGRLGSGETEEKDALLVSPNPAESRLRVRFGTVAGGRYALRLADRQGWPVVAKLVGSGVVYEQAIEAAPLAVGSVLVVLEGEGRRESKKVILLRKEPGWFVNRKAGAGQWVGTRFCVAS